MTKIYTTLGNDGLAEKSGWVTAYNYAVATGEYIAQTDEYLAVGVGIPASSTTAPPPDPVNGYARVFRGGLWSQVEDHRGELWYNISTGSEFVISALGSVDTQVYTRTKPAAPVIPLKTQATSALSTARTYIYNNYGILNEDTPDDWVTYLKALMAISKGTDTTSTALPTAPVSTDTGTSSTTAASTTAASAAS